MGPRGGLSYRNDNDGGIAVLVMRSIQQTMKYIDIIISRIYNLKLGCCVAEKKTHKLNFFIGISHLSQLSYSIMMQGMEVNISPSAALQYNLTSRDMKSICQSLANATSGSW